MRDSGMWFEKILKYNNNFFYQKMSLYQNIVRKNVV